MTLSQQGTNDNSTAAVRVMRHVSIRDVDDDKPILDLDEIHCLSDWSLTIVVAVASANAIFFFYHMVLILVVRLRQQVSSRAINCFRVLTAMHFRI